MSQINQAIQTLRNGQFIIVTDDLSRENEGDLVIAAEMILPEHVAFMLRHTGGVICVPMLPERLHELSLPQMVTDNTDPRGTAFTVSVDSRLGVTTGISAQDRAHTIRLLASSDCQPEDLSRPGHIFPLQYRNGGVLKRAGHTEASIDLLKIAGITPVAAISEIVNSNGSMKRGDELLAFSKEHKIPLISVSEIIQYRRKQEKLVDCISQAVIPTDYGKFIAHVYRSRLDHIENLALVMGQIDPKKDMLVRVHSECLTGDVFGSRRCDCGNQLHEALKMISEKGSGVLVYLRGQEGRGIGLGHKLRAYTLQDSGLDTVEANVKLGLPIDSREYGIGAQILADLGVTSIELMTNNPAKYSGIEAYGLKITKRVPLIPNSAVECQKYLKTKKEKMGHFLEVN